MSTSNNQNLDQKRFLAEMAKEEEVIDRYSKGQLAHFSEASKEKVQGIQLPKGVMLRYNLAESLYFYLETAVDGGGIVTKVYASNSPYEKDNRVMVGEMRTPIFDEKTGEDSNVVHSRKVEQAVNDWISFVDDQAEVDEDQPFTSFAIDAGDS
ncbi:Hypothetical protein PBC10988_14690 [Planctomycetales bacterium 10988]|nr:Hypothetical protein PBC10988_14690 [Planctomycetales bacterium 10988]